MNFAIQGNISNNFTQDTLEIDYVRLYQDQKSSITERLIHQPEFYPNPVKDQLSIKCGNGADEFSHITIYSSDGCEISSDDILSDNGLIVINNLSSLNTGIYCLQYTFSGHTYNFTFVKE